jgi:hypothetical protein
MAVFKTSDDFETNHSFVKPSKESPIPSAKAMDGDIKGNKAKPNIPMLMKPLYLFKFFILRLVRGTKLPSTHNQNKYQYSIGYN